jgi:hypothetical protein
MSASRIEYLSGVCFGLTGEFTAVAVLERTQGPANPDRPPAHYAVRLLERFPPGTPYGEVCDGLAGLFDQQPLRRSHLVVDHTGVGRPVLDLLRRTRIAARLCPVAVTAGQSAVADERGGWRVPRVELVSVLQVLLQGRRIRIAPSLPDAATLVRELSTFEAKPAKADTDSLEHWRQGPQDDLVLAVAAPCWYGERQLRHLCIFA